MGSYIPETHEGRADMLTAIGLESAEELYSVVPEEVRSGELNLPEGLSELEVVSHMEALANENVRFGTVLRGAGAYRHHIPAIVKTVTSKEEFVTAYTPYQAEISQGVLQSIFEYQTQICELTGMDVSNASVYDGATAAAEAVLMCLDRKRGEVVVAESVNPDVITVIKTYCASRNVPVVTVGMKDDLTLDLEALQAAIGPKTAAVYVQSPNYLGVIEDMDAIVAATHGAGAKLVMGFNPISLGILRTPGEYGADVAVAEGQPLGLPLGFGGPYLGIMAATKAMMRKLPGRIVGQTTDADGRRAFVLTLQAREQHIRREKASSNICSNEALCAMTASVYLATVGPDGLAQAARLSAGHAHYLADKLAELGFAVVSDRPFFNEFLTTCPIDADQLVDALEARGILAGLPTHGGILWCATELNTRSDIDRAVQAIKEVCDR
ncbi:MAG: aminomethyl-transferring glycine dehydrogenase subunit GcvPA [Coriobacteriales bacterium]|nr:aminomethyl-transferring glycine dehydrogenase subunit GcvPA [Coriobacteriales bacterium]